MICNLNMYKNKYEKNPFERGEIVNSCLACIKLEWDCSHVHTVIVKRDLLIQMPQFYIVFVLFKRPYDLDLSSLNNFFEIFYLFSMMTKCQIKKWHPFFEADFPNI